MLKAIFRRLKQNGRAYLSIMLGLALGAYVFTTAFSVASALDDRLAELEVRTSYQSIRADIPSSQLELLDHDSPELMQTAGCRLGISTIVHIGATRTGMPDSIIFIALPDFYFEELLGVEMTAQTAYCSSSLLDELQADSLRLFPSSAVIDLDCDRLLLNEGRFELDVLDGNSTVTAFPLTDDPSDDLPLDRVILLPEVAGVELRGERFRSHSLYAAPASPEAHPEAYRLIYQTLDGISPIISDPAARHLKACSEISDLLSLAELTALCLLLVTLLGTVGILLLTLTKRRGELAILSALGCTKVRAAVELTAEISIVCGLGVLLGTLLTLPTLPKLEAIIPYFESVRAAVPLAPMLAILFAVTTITTSVILSGLDRLDIVKILKGEY